MTQRHTLNIDLVGEQIHLRPDRTLFWPRRFTLFAADLHWGKAETFLKAGVPVSPEGTTADLHRLSTALHATAAERLVILGDLFHAKMGLTPGLFQQVLAWRMEHPQLEILLIRGNHDQRSGDPPAEWQFQIHSEPYRDDPFAYRHYPNPTAAAHTLAGHIHAGVILRGKGRQRLRLPCFFVSEQVTILPAFGAFTGQGILEPGPMDRIFVIAGDEVLPFANSLV